MLEFWLHSSYELFFFKVRYKLEPVVCILSLLIQENEVYCITCVKKDLYVVVVLGLHLSLLCSI